jgi:hypothetical protein
MRKLNAFVLRHVSTGPRIHFLADMWQRASLSVWNCWFDAPHVESSFC